ncbi:MAG: ATP-dependent DNA ligase [Candidatus Amesbacteria bacterium]|nr:ATP-dependent DNA ligase [Candidatus Amesbacteria bacterium]
MKFSELAKYLHKLEGTAGRNEMTVILAEMFALATPEEARLIAYMTQGKLGPAYKSPDFGIADKSMVKALGGEAKILFDKLGDLGLVIEQLKSIKVSKYKSIKVSEVYEKLWDIATISGTGSQDKKQQLIINLLSEVDPVSAKYIVKMILGKLRTGFSDMTILDSLSWMLSGSKKLKPQIEAMYNVRADLGQIAMQVKMDKGVKRELGPVIGTPILMAKCERAETTLDIWERLDKCAVEYKLDGLRIQAHISDKVTLFSRGLENVTSMYPDICEGLKKQINHNCIVEGEMIALDKNGRFLPFQETVQRKRKYDILEMLETVPLNIFLFDVLMLDGSNVMNEANETRRKLLESIVTPGDTVKLMIRNKIEQEKEIEEFFQQSLKAGTEGIIAKKLDGGYAAGARDFNWIKYKKSYQQSALSDTLDVVVMGYDEGQGKRSKFGIGDFLAGVYNPESDKYFTIAKVGTGLTDEEWQRMASNLKPQITMTKPSNFEVSSQMKCDHWVEPKIVVELLADEITKSPMHTSGYALRFPRLVSFREKKPTDATSMKELEKMVKLQKDRR